MMVGSMYIMNQMLVMIFRLSPLCPFAFLLASSESDNRSWLVDVAVAGY